MPGDVLGELIATDRDYFCAGAVNEALDHATLSTVPGYAHLAVGCVVHSVDPSSVGDADGWVGDVEARVAHLGGSVARIYLPEQADGVERMEKALGRRGYVARVEVAYATSEPTAPTPAVTISPLDPADDDAWATATEVHRVGGIGTGIYAVDPSDWTDIMRRRCASSAMQGWLVAVDGEPCGTVGSLRTGALVRSKNLLIDRRFRRRSLGSAVIARLWSDGAPTGPSLIGAFAVDGTPGSRFYPAAGFDVVGAQVEWARPLG